jgi:hypothetical protein
MSDSVLKDLKVKEADGAVRRGQRETSQALAPALRRLFEFLGLNQRAFGVHVVRQGGQHSGSKWIVHFQICVK